MRILVTSALPYANGEIHFGHLAGAYLPADIYVKYLRLKGSDVLFICGSDEHGVPIALAARQAGMSPQEVVDRFHPSIRGSLEGFGVEFDNYSRTSLPLHHETAQEFFRVVHRKGFVHPQTTRQLFCPQCRMFLADRYVEGTCPSCGAEGARGDQCEACGRWIEPFDLIDARCMSCGASPEVRETTHWFFALSRLEGRLRAWVGSKPDWKPNVRRFCEGWFSRGLQDRSITRDLEWGVPVPLPEARGKVMYVWFDAPIGYISSTKEWAERTGRPERWQDYWLDPRTKLVHFIGKDNIAFHAIVWPAMLMAHNDGSRLTAGGSRPESGGCRSGEFVLPAEIPANEFLNLEGAKLSTSRNWAVWLPDYLARFPADPLRYALAVNLPENRDVDFTWRDYLARNNNELADVFGNFVNRVAVFVRKNYSGRVPCRRPEDAESGSVLAAIASAPARIGGLIESFQLKDAAREMMALAGLGNRYFDYQAPWRSFREDRPKCDRTIAVCCRLVSLLEVVSYPFLPFTSRKLGRMLGLGHRSWDNAARADLPAELGEAEILFRKLDEAIVAEETAKLGRKWPVTSDQYPMQTGDCRLQTPKCRKEAGVISFEEFKKVELKTALIVSAEPVAGTKKLVRMTIDLGAEQRLIVAGIGDAYEPEELIGKTIVVVANLQPALIRGVQSSGMLLAAVAGESLALLTLDRPVPPGTPVS